MTSRIASHRRRWDDTIAIAFIECGHAELGALERSTITQTEQSSHIRNKMLARMPAGEAEIDLVVDKEQQAEWLEGAQPSYPLGERTRAAGRRARNRAKSDDFMAHPAGASALGDLAAYVNAVIPWPSAMGGLYWGVQYETGSPQETAPKAFIADEVDSFARRRAAVTKYNGA